MLIRLAVFVNQLLEPREETAGRPWTAPSFRGRTRYPLLWRLPGRRWPPHYPLGLKGLQPLQQRPPAARCPEAPPGTRRWATRPPPDDLGHIYPHEVLRVIGHSSSFPPLGPILRMMRAWVAQAQIHRGSGSQRNQGGATPLSHGLLRPRGIQSAPPLSQTVFASLPPQDTRGRGKSGLGTPRALAENPGSPHPSYQRAVVLAYCPVNLGSRFSAKALMASLWSWVRVSTN